MINSQSKALLRTASRTVHRLKTKAVHFQKVLEGSKPYELRFNDRNFQQGDILVLLEFEQSLTGRSLMATVSHILTHNDVDGLKEGFVCLGLDFKVPMTNNVLEPSRKEEEK